MVRAPTFPFILALLATLAACAPSTEVPGLESIGSQQSALTPAQRRARAAQIRDAASAAGMTQGWMLAGIAQAETGLAHCWSEATWACQGPNSPDCGGGPVIAGAGDGPCSLMQGGLGLFQFDGGTFDQTLARDGVEILRIDGNVTHAVEFVTDMVIRSEFISGVSTAAEAIAWMNEVRIGNAHWDPWIRTVTRYYNGCRPTASCWSSRYASYRDKTVNVYEEMGADFWGESGTATWTAQFVSQSFPFARDPFELAPGEEQSGYLEMRNTGSESWRPGEVFLGTTEPRDGASPLTAGDWVSSSRAATIDRVVDPGNTGRFMFSVRAPTTAGDYPQYFNLVREGESWFSVPGDNVIQVRVTVTPSGCPAGLSARWQCEGAARRRCVAGGSVEEESCMHGCLDDGGGAVCGSAPIDEDRDGFSRGEDCDDSNPDVYPGAPDPCGDGVDADCNGIDLCSADGGPFTGDAASIDASVPADADAMRPTPIHSGCSASPNGSSNLWFVVAFGALLWRRRRRS